MRRAGLALILVGGIVAAAAAVGLLTRETPVPAVADVEVLATPDPEPSEPEPEPEPPAAGVPIRVVIDAIGVDHPVIPVGLEPDGAMEIPEDVHEIGWYKLGIMPGEYGSAVLSGHVDSRTQGRGAFYDLRLLEPGDLVAILDEDGVERSWEVTQVVRYPKDELPIDDLFRWRGDATDLVLITCGGAFDRGIGHYEDNIVAYTTPI